jgi:outer membrane lipoprotein-sorting protein
MPLLSRRRAVWAVPAVVVGTVLAGALAPGLAAGRGHTRLAPRTAAQLLVAVRGSSVQHLSGTVVETARLGLPDLPGADRSAALSWQSLVTGSHTARIWVDGPEHQRIALIGQLSESDIVHSGTDLWTYSSADNAVTHAALPADRAATPVPASTEVPLTPQAAAAQALKAIDPSTKVAVDAAAEVAGHAAYTLSLTPRDSRSTVRRVLISVDGETGVPLRVQVFGSAVAAAFETAFTDVSFRRPSASVFRFTPPKHAVVTQHDLSMRPGGAQGHAPTATTAPDPAAADQPTVIGQGWTSILVLRQPAAPAGTAKNGRQASSNAVLDQLTRTLPNGDRLLKTSLVNALMTKDGRIFVGAVTPDLLVKAAAGSAG